MSDYEVTLVDGKMSEFFVKFHGPAESTSSLYFHHHLLCYCNRANLQHHSLKGYGRFMWNYPRTSRINHLVLDSWTRSFILILMRCTLSFLLRWSWLINRSGSVCLDVINQTWSPMFGESLTHVYPSLDPSSLIIPPFSSSLSPENRNADTVADSQN